MVNFMMQRTPSMDDVKKILVVALKSLGLIKLEQVVVGLVGQWFWQVQ